jgi:hypothetical protein
VGHAGANHERRADRGEPGRLACDPITGPESERRADRASPRRRAPPVGPRDGRTRAPRRPPLPASRGRVRQGAGGIASSMIAMADVRAVGFFSGADPPPARGAHAFVAGHHARPEGWTKTPAWEPVARGGDLVALVVLALVVLQGEPLPRCSSLVPAPAPRLGRGDFVSGPRAESPGRRPMLRR